MCVFMHLSILVILEDGFFFHYLAGTCHTLFMIMSNISTGKQQENPALNGIKYVWLFSLVPIKYNIEKV